MTRTHEMTKPPQGRPPYGFSVFDPELNALVARARGSSGGNSFAYDERKTLRAKEDFLSKRKDGRGDYAIPDAIRKSWERSLASGIETGSKGSVTLSSSDELELLRRRNRDLMSSTRPLVARLGKTLCDAATMVAITDPRGTILDVAGSSRTISWARDIQLEVGALWTEAKVGTNGIGTAIASGEPVHVHAAEHFCDGIKAWACVGAPIFSPIDRSIMGVVDFSGPHNVFHRHSVALAVMAARQIEFLMVERLQTERMRLLEAALELRHGLAGGDALVIVDRFGQIVHANDRGRERLVSLEIPSSLRLDGKILAFDGTLEGIASLIDKVPTVLQHRAIEPLMIDGLFGGALLILEANAEPSKPSTDPIQSAERTAPPLIGVSDNIRMVRDTVARARENASSILIVGETGTGKSLIADLVHTAAVASGCRFDAKHDAEALVKALTSWEAGPRGGQGPAALIVENVTDAAPGLQSAMLRAMDLKPEDRRQLIFTNAREPLTDVESGAFRADVYYRMAGLRIDLLPLRARPEDVEPLLHHFSDLAAHASRRERLSFDAECVDTLRRCVWRGNVRELENFVRSLHLRAAKSVVTCDDLPAYMREPGEPHDQRSLEEAERIAIEQALAEANGNVTVAAARLGIARSTIYRKLGSRA